MTNQDSSNNPTFYTLPFKGKIPENFVKWEPPPNQKTLTFQDFLNAPDYEEYNPDNFKHINITLEQAEEIHKWLLQSLEEAHQKEVRRQITELAKWSEIEAEEKYGSF